MSDATVRKGSRPRPAGLQLMTVVGLLLVLNAPDALAGYAGSHGSSLGPSSVQVGESLPITTTVQNTGTSSWPYNYPVQSWYYYVVSSWSSTVVQVSRYSAVSAGAPDSSVYTLTSGGLLPPPTEPGAYNVLVYAYYPNYTSGYFELMAGSPRQLDFTVQPAATPDLVIERLYVSPSSSTGTAVTATLKVANMGGAAAGAFGLDFYQHRVTAPGGGDVGDATWSIASLAAGGSVVKTHSFTPASDGSYQAYAQVDRGAAVAESDETNNKKGPFYYKRGSFGEAVWRAVICGISDYPGTVNDLNYCDDDAIDLNAALLEYPAWTNSNIQLLVDTAATKAGVKAAIDTMRQAADANDVCLFFFSGHGTTGSDVFPADESDNVDEYICTCDSASLANYVRDDELGEWLDAFPSSVAVILDTCFSGGQVKAPAGDSGAKGLSMGYPAPAPGDGFANDIRLLGRLPGAKDLDDGLQAGGVVVTACDDDESSQEAEELENGVFTEYVLEALLGARTTADADSSAFVSAEETYAYAAPLATTFNSSQHAQLHDAYPSGSPSADQLPVIEFGTVTISNAAACVISAGNLELKWASYANRCYDIDWTTNLAEGFPNVVATDIPSSPPMNTYTVDTCSATAPNFYRVRLKQP